MRRSLLEAYKEVNQFTNMNSNYSQLFAFLVLLTSLFYLYKSRIQSKIKQTAAGFTAKDAMIACNELLCFEHGVTMEKALSKALKSYQEFFPVLHADNLLGILKRSDLLKETITAEPNYVASIMNRNFITVNPDIKIDKVIQLLSKHSIIVVNDGAKTLGFLVQDKVEEFLLVLGLKKDFEVNEEVL